MGLSMECNLITIVASATWAINLELPVIKMNVAQFTYDKNNINVVGSPVH